MCVCVCVCVCLCTGKLHPSYKSEPEPLQEAPPGKVRTVVYKTSHTLGAAGSEEAMLVLLYQPYAAGKFSKVRIVGLFSPYSRSLLTLIWSAQARIRTLLSSTSSLRCVCLCVCVCVCVRARV